MTQTAELTAAIEDHLQQYSVTYDLRNLLFRQHKHLLSKLGREHKGMDHAELRNQLAQIERQESSSEVYKQSEIGAVTLTEVQESDKDLFKECLFVEYREDLKKSTLYYGMKLRSKRLQYNVMESRCL